MSIQVPRDSEGYLIDPDDWNQGIAHELAKEENMDLSDTYWPVLHFVRDHYCEHSIVPDVRYVTNFLAIENQCDKKQEK